MSQDPLAAAPPAGGRHRAGTAAPAPSPVVPPVAPPVVPPVVPPVAGAGRVVSRDGWPVSGASVTLLGADGTQRARATTAGDGRFALGDVPAGAATLVVAAPAHEPRATGVVVPAAGTWRVGDVTLERTGGQETPPPGVWVVDPAHSAVLATAHHLGLSSVHGRFTRFAGVVTVPEGDPAASRVEIEIDASSIDTGNEQRDGHLRSADLLDVEHHPRVRFVADEVRRDGAGWVLPGRLTLLDVTRPVELALTYLGSGRDAEGRTRAAFSATTELHRDDFRLSWNRAVGVGVAIFGTTLKVAIDVQAVRQDDPA
ncbi:YceI family protein [Cellulomonas marina]|uniref:Polyisoprenoid-binding protein YceI n=1 Tax=Cellulomonas marina TaxID=988821 RepID=A0A1I0WP50_9CELL|nr:YceI family protein [Cellulomonas marina]GIG27779.1 hypothetical protein Cma02nite_03790 [Cellulomonas marina]SFA90391.1 Polyisoprenoid-binding protein YceI [Cellulomonas marina]